MKYIGNYADWIQSSWIDEIKSAEGLARPRDWNANSAYEAEEYRKAELAGYRLSDVHFWLYEKNNLTFDIVPPWSKGPIHWWITKMYPGQFTPMHTDPHTFEQACRRYWIPLLDHKPGHIFVYKDTAILNYKAGDVFEYVNANDLHGAANIGHEVRIILQVTEYE